MIQLKNRTFKIIKNYLKKKLILKLKIKIKYSMKIIYRVNFWILKFSLK